MRGFKSTAALTISVLVLAAGTASARTVPGTDAGEVLRGTAKADTIHGYGGADLIYGYGGRDTVWGGNEAGRGDKILGGASGDHLVGQQGHDALYGEGGSDRLEGQNGDDLVAGGAGEDTLVGGPGADKIDARDGRKDTIAIRLGEGDVVYYDRGLDVLEVPVEGRGNTDDYAAMTAAEAIAAGKIKLLSEEPPEVLFGHTGEVLVDHEGERLLVAEDEVGNHVEHGDEVLDPTGRAGA